MAQKITVAHLKYNLFYKEGNDIHDTKQVQEHYTQLALSGEGEQVKRKMDLAIKNFAYKYGLFNIQSVSPEEYNKAKGIKDESITKV